MSLKFLVYKMPLSTVLELSVFKMADMGFLLLLLYSDVVFFLHILDVFT